MFLECVSAGGAKSMGEQYRKIVCQHCDAVIAFPLGKQAVRARCGRCYKALFSGKPFPVSAKGFDIHIRYNDIPGVISVAPHCGKKVQRFF
jgi:thioredoxin 2